MAKLEESLKEDNAYGKVDKRKVFWGWDDNESRIYWSIKFGVNRLASYSAKANNMHEGVGFIRDYIAGLHNKDSNWKELVQQATKLRGDIRKRLVSKGGRKKK